MINLSVQFYIPTDTQRLAEIEECLSRNLENQHIKRLFVFLEKQEDRQRLPASEKIEVIVHQGRLTFAGWLDRIKRTPSNEVCLLANSDIFFDDTIGILSARRNDIFRNRTFLALARHEVCPDGSRKLVERPDWMQDAWAILNTPGHEPSSAMIQDSNFALGIPGCDNKIAFVAHNHGYSLKNPCGIIRAFHLHAASHRSYDEVHDKLGGLHAYAQETKSLEETSKVRFSLVSRSVETVKKITINDLSGHKRKTTLRRTPF